MVLKMEVESNLEKKFRELSQREFGYVKGALKKAGTQAITDWIQKREPMNKSDFERSMKKLKGALGHLRGKFTSVELQHETSRLWKELD